MTSDGSQIREHIGRKLKELRQQQQLSLRALAARVDFSASFLSQVELGQVSPSIGSLDRIAQALGVYLSDLLSQSNTPNGPWLRHRKQASLHSDWSRATVESLLPAQARGKTGIVLVRIEPGGQSGKWSSLSPSDEELAFCLRGKAKVTITDKQYHLHEGDSIFYKANEISRWENPGRGRLEILFVALRSS